MIYMRLLLVLTLLVLVCGCVSGPPREAVVTTTTTTTVTTTSTATVPTTSTIVIQAVTTSTTTSTVNQGIQSQRWVLDEGIRVGEGVSPEVVELDDGRLRMYVTGDGISSYISSDGLEFRLEKEKVIEDGFNPAIIRLPNQSYRMIYNVVEGRMNDPSRRLYFKSAISTDGLNFTVEEGVRYRSTGSPDYDAISVPNIIRMSDGRLRMYYTGDMFAPERGRDGNNIRSAVSYDQGWSWRREEGVRLPFESMDSDIVAIPGGGYRMYYTAHTNDWSKDDQRVYSAISMDGLDFTVEGEVLAPKIAGLRYMDPEVVETPLGYRMYFSEAVGRSGDEETLIKSAVWETPRRV